MFVDALTKHCDVPGDSGEWMKLRPLSFLEIDDAQVKGYIGMMRTVAEMSEVQETITRIYSAAEEARKKVEEAKAEAPEEPGDPEAEAAIAKAEKEDDPLEGLDQLTVLVSGIVAWSYDRPVNEENIRLLDTDTARWAALEIVGLRSKEDLEKGSPPSTQR